MKESLRRLLEIVEELDNLQDEARELLEEYPETLERLEESGALNFGKSNYAGGPNFTLEVHLIEE